MQGRTFIINLISISFLICLLMGSAPAGAQEETKKHVVGAIDNYYSISLKYDVSVADLKLANPGINNPKPGDILIIPGKDGGSEMVELDAGECAKLSKKRHEVYHIALMIPFYLEQVGDTLWKESLDPARINDLPPFRFIQYYHGFMAAADSLRQKGLNVEIYVYDVDNQTSKVLSVLQRPELEKMDMIVGPFFKNSFATVAEFAKENKIPIINPLSSRDDILQGNPYVFKLLPSVESQPALVAELVRQNYSGHKIIFYIANKYQNTELIAQFTRAIEQIDKTGQQKVKLVDYASDSLQGFREMASYSQPNLVIIYADNEVLPASLLSKLSALKSSFDITVIGLPEWEKFTNIESRYLIELNAIVFMSSYTNTRSADVQSFIRAYRSKYFDEPMYYAFAGFDAGYFFLGALLNYGKGFERCLDEIRVPLVQNQFQFEKKTDGGYDNLNWNVLQYLDYFLLKKSF